MIPAVPGKGQDPASETTMRHYVLRGLSLGALLAAAACTNLSSTTLKSGFDPAEVAWSRTPGTATIRGTAVWTARGGATHTCAGQSASLTPVSAYSREVHQQLRTSGGQITIANPDERAGGYVRTTKCDDQGGFVFDDLPAGDWFVRASVTWEVRGIFYATSTEGGVLSEPATTHRGETVNVALAR
jgi:hypothetical protein